MRAVTEDFMDVEVFDNFPDTFHLTGLKIHFDSSIVYQMGVTDIEDIVANCKDLTDDGCHVIIASTCAIQDDDLKAWFTGESRAIDHKDVIAGISLWEDREGFNVVLAPRYKGATATE